MISEILSNSKKIVVKVGTNTLSNSDGTINREKLQMLCRQIYALIQKGKQVVVVSSGARIAGVATINKWSLKEDIHYKQALCSIGQVELMHAYRESFNKYDIHIGQLLLTKDDFLSPNRVLNIRNTLFTLLDEGVVPIVNENDTVCVEEIKIGDNDNLAALTSVLWNADTLVLLSDVDGIFDKNPKEHEDAVLLEKVHDIDDLLKNIEIGEKNSFGLGGIPTKIEAAKKVNAKGIFMILANGNKKNILIELLDDKEKATLFIPDKKVGHPIKTMSN
jgi:glutamate 5-kinase